MRVILCAAILFFSACVTSANPDQAIRSALDISAEVIAPASKLAVDGCIAAQEAVLQEAKAGSLNPDKAGEQIAQIRLRCTKLRVVFDALRTKHEAARKYVEEGKLVEAQQALDDVKLLFRSLGEIP